MRKITQDAVNAFKNREGFNRDNTRVSVDPITACVHLELFGNLIAEGYGRTVAVTLAGFNTRTTRDRVNGLLQELSVPFRFHTYQGQAYFRHLEDTSNGMPVDDTDWLEIDLFEHTYAIWHQESWERRTIKL